MIEWKTIPGESYVAIPCAAAAKVSIGIGNVFYELQPITPNEFGRILEKRENRELIGVPTVFCHILPYALNVWPAPDKEYDVVCERANSSYHDRVIAPFVGSLWSEIAARAFNESSDLGLDASKPKNDPFDPKNWGV